MTLPPTRPWYRRKRAWAAVALWLVVAYPLGLGPLTYLDHRGWFPARYWDFLYLPLRPVVRDLGPATPLEGYVLWWGGLADRHDAASD